VRVTFTARPAFAAVAARTAVAARAGAALSGAEPAERVDPTGRRRDLRLALCCLAGGLALLALGYTDGGTDGGWGRLLLVGPLVAMCGALMLRRLAPVPAVALAVTAGIADLVLGPSLGTILVFTQVIYDAGVYGRRWLLPWLLRIAVGATVAVAAGTLAVHGMAYAVATGVALTLVTVLPLVTALPVRQHRERARTERERAEQIARLAELDRRNAVAAERARMARELHDLVANHLSAVAIHATAALSRPDLGEERMHEILTVMRDSSVQGLAEMRRLVELLREPQPYGDSLAEVGALVERARVGQALAVTLSEDGERGELAPAVDLAAYRIVQESLTNAGKHAAGGSADVRIRYDDRAVEIVVDSFPPPSNGRRPVAAPFGALGAGLGITGMRERAALLGGTFTAGPHDGGWRVRAELPRADAAQPPGTEAAPGPDAAPGTEAASGAEAAPRADAARLPRAGAFG
jgi:signal transduction histidine kinase